MQYFALSKTILRPSIYIEEYLSHFFAMKTRSIFPHFYQYYELIYDINFTSSIFCDRRFMR